MEQELNDKEVVYEKLSRAKFTTTAINGFTTGIHLAHYAPVAKPRLTLTL